MSEKISLTKKIIVSATLISMMLIGIFQFTVVEAQADIARIPLLSKPKSLSPFKVDTVWTAIVVGTVFESLVATDPNNPSRVIPWLAESYEVNEDGTEWVFRLRKDVVWHDGKPFTADDVVFTFNLVKERKTSGFWYTNVPIIVESVEKIDDYTVRFKLKQPYAPFLLKIAAAPILPKHIWEPIAMQEDFDPSKYEPTIDQLVGTGPFKIVSFDPAVGASYVANENYWGPKPKISRLIYPVIDNQDAMYLSLKKGEVDTVTWSIPPNAVEEAMRDPNIAVMFVVEPSFFFLGYNTQRYPFTLKEFRKVIAYIIDRQYIVDNLLGGFGIPGNPGLLSPVFGEMVNPRSFEYVRFDLEEARRILDSLGFIDRDGDGIRETPNGTKLEFEVIGPAYDPVRVQIGNLLAQWAAEVGIKINNNPVDLNEMIDRIVNTGNFDMFLEGWINELDPDWIYDLLHSSQASPNGFNIARFNNPELDRLLEMQRVITDFEERKDIVWRIQELIADELPYVSLYHRVSIYGIRIDKLGGWVQSIGFGYNPMAIAFGFVNGWSLLNIQPAMNLPKPVIQNVRFETAGNKVMFEVAVEVNGQPMSNGEVIINMIGLTKPGFKGQIMLTDPSPNGVFKGTLAIQGFEPGRYLAQIIARDPNGGMSKQVLEIEIAEAMEPVETETVTVTETETVTPEKMEREMMEEARTVIREVTVVKTVTGVETKTVTVTETVAMGPSTAQIAAIAIIVIVVAGLIAFLSRRRS